MHRVSAASLGRVVGRPTFPGMAVVDPLPPGDIDGYTASKRASEVALECAHG
ncbi:hypothetical protein HBI56_170220 [Parastagonospora nodorum]|uniref:Uncharacterized protein n=1 Tax=Phaeosphaeria nodorum (strain SN15 / ATCC MYA-4574 / FGSC 10173) TaxID=321614 RepID=A0A7U2FAW8_PHANO|nr:hypothetical protein HBH56_245240 [Parastagonospora nodorum]QRD01922.1 hypothetical protein JI435_417380 [Parastagonospora nodorum SN15]KAH3935925.1 hypothetical protein HBH54_034310 [Parastagonospora nodorum]KAH3988650.1 hypothetical protein HBH52_023500 [Parastagonospora nodorum]KAH3992180.1 hypothetical protein HBI10_218730 [Parastagonospora nodorum]